MPTIRRILQIASVCLIFQTAGLLAAEVSIQRIHEEPKGMEEDPQDYIRVTIDGRVYRCASLGNWGVLDNARGYDLVATPPNGISGIVGVRVERCVDAKGKPFPHFTQELLDAQIKRMQPEGPRYENTIPPLQDSMTTVEFDVLCVEKAATWKCRYRLSLVGDQLWVFACEASPAHYEASLPTFGALSATFARASD